LRDGSQVAGVAVRVLAVVAVTVGVPPCFAVRHLLLTPGHTVLRVQAALLHTRVGSVGRVRLVSESVTVAALLAHLPSFQTRGVAGCSVTVQTVLRFSARVSVVPRTPVAESRVARHRHHGQNSAASVPASGRRPAE